ncbi:MAG TPA: T9SS type A sorting domain-containing protein [Bacteroidota bacterium]
MRFVTKARSFAIILGLSAVCSAAAVAQITITATNLTNLFGPGATEFTYSNRDSSETMNVGIPSNSVAQAWALPAFTILDSSEVDNVPPASTPYAADFPGATYAETFSRTDTGVTVQFYEYLLLSGDSLYFMGAAEHFSGSPGGHAIDSTVVQHGSRFILHVPISLGNVIVSRPDTAVLGPGIFQVVTTSTTYDAYGTLTLPNGSYQALRSYQVTSFRVYNGSSLLNSSTAYSLVWSTLEGHQLSVSIDSGATSGTVSLHSVSWTRVAQTPTFVSTRVEPPASFVLEQNYPNPFNPSTNISYTVPKRSLVTVRVYDMLGREVATLVDAEKEPGSYRVSFDATKLAGGVYVYRLQAGNFTATKKLLLLK